MKRLQFASSGSRSPPDSPRSEEKQVHFQKGINHQNRHSGTINSGGSSPRRKNNEVTRQGSSTMNRFQFQNYHMQSQECKISDPFSSNSQRSQRGLKKLAQQKVNHESSCSEIFSKQFNIFKSRIKVEYDSLMKEMKDQDKRLKEMEIEEWQLRRLHRQPKPQKKRKTSSQEPDSQNEDEESEKNNKSPSLNKAKMATTD